MKPEVYARYREVHSRHWWFLHRRRILESLLDRELGESGAASRIGIDFGCGPGGETALVSRYCDSVVGFERSSDALKGLSGSRPEVSWLCADLNRAGQTIRPASLDVALLCNVIYHSWIEDDAKQIEVISRLLKPGGLLIVTEAAFDSLRRARDDADGGARRYRLPQICQMGELEAFERVEATYFNMLPFPFAWLLARLQPSRGASKGVAIDDLAMPPRWLNGAILTLLGLERAALRWGIPIPFGMNILTAWRKRGEGEAKASSQVGT
jgi:SAM-dependent methyltransferase